MQSHRPEQRPTNPPQPRGLFAVRALGQGMALLLGLLGPGVVPAAAGEAATSAPSLAALIEQGEKEAARLRGLEKKIAEASAAQAARERQAAQAAVEIERLKAEPPGVTRDLKLGQRLAQAQAEASELSAAEAARRQLASELTAARRRLLHLCDRILDADAESKLSSGQRFSWLRLRTAQVEALLPGDGAQKAEALARSELLAGSSDAAALDDPQALRERADLLRDSADKLRREIDRLRARAEELTRRQRLRERASRVDEDLFAEQSTARRRTSTFSQTGGGEAAPVAAAADGAIKGGPVAPPAGSGALSPVPATPRSGPDPATLDALLRVEGPGDPAAKLQALGRAQGELETLEKDLLQRAGRLEQRAATLSRQK
jgi:hypothetical protein